MYVSKAVHVNVCVSTSPSPTLLFLKPFTQIGEVREEGYKATIARYICA